MTMLTNFVCNAHTCTYISESERERQRQTDRQRKIEKDRERERERETKRDRERVCWMDKNPKANDNGVI